MTVDAAAALVCRLYQAFEDGDHEAIRACLASDVQWRQADAAVPAAGQTATGADALIDRVVVPLEREWEGFTEEVDELIAAGGRVIATGTYRGTYRATGRSIEAEFCHLWWVENDEIRRFRQFTDTAAFAVATAP
ncbi:nuclear transport factor 2 family protein [Egicoccus sp. AB-alg6-2]|uniref:nuclear transport factor 2 family protein n=1 Tax=Egicoccus sp. AB-alg6-2 TaxID=3242692 RepID=UPI00359D2E5B